MESLTTKLSKPDDANTDNNYRILCVIDYVILYAMS